MAEFRAKKAEQAKRIYWRKKPPRRDPMTAAFFGTTARWNEPQMVAPRG